MTFQRIRTWNKEHIGWSVLLVLLAFLGGILGQKLRTKFSDASPVKPSQRIIHRPGAIVVSKENSCLAVTTPPTGRERVGRVEFISTETLEPLGPEMETTNIHQGWGALSPKASYFASYSYPDKRITIWDVVEGQTLYQSSLDMGEVRPYSLSDDGRRVLFIWAERDAEGLWVLWRVYDTTNGNTLVEGKRPWREVSSFALSADGHLLATQTRAGIKVYAVPGGTLQRTIDNPHNQILSVNQGQWIGTQKGRTLRLFDFKGKQIGSDLDHGSLENALVTGVDEKAKRAIVFGKDDRLTVFDIESGQRLAEYPNTGQWWGNGAISSDGKLITSSVLTPDKTESTVTIYSVDDEKVEAQILFEQNRMLAWSVNDSFILLQDPYVLSVEAWTY